MAVRDDGLYYPTEAIISRKGRKHYRVPVRSQHWQLRSLISAEKRHIVYFPGGHGSNHVQRLNTQTRECETIKLLTFAPRCLVAKDGWVCCGSEHGEFAAIRLDEDGASDGADADLDFDSSPAGVSSPGDSSLLSMLSRARGSNKTLIAKNVKLAKERVNCITLWTPPTRTTACEHAYNFAVAVLANNDRTVTLVNLEDPQREQGVCPLDTISYPDFVNRAVISPDGRFLIAILDDPYLYIHERVGRDGDAVRSSRSGSQGCWKERQRILLKSQKKDDKSDSRGSFAACFSASGAYLAVGTQHGTVSIFDTSLLTEPDCALITTFQSSRPQSGQGAIRDMAFCPGPYDVLAWTEDRGHVGLADVRSNFAVRQIVDINAEADYDHVNVLDRNTVDPRLMNRRGVSSNQRGASSGQQGGNAPETTAEERRRAAADRFNTLNHPLTSNEMMVLDAIRSDRQRRERQEGRPGRGGTGAGSDDEAGVTTTTPYSRWVHYPHATATSTGQGERGGGPGGGSATERSSSASRAIDELLGNYRDQRDRAHERVRNARQFLRGVNERQQPAAAQTPLQSRRPEQQWIDRIGEQVAALRSQRERPDSSYLTLLEILQARERSSNARANNGSGNNDLDTEDDDDDDDNDGFLPVPRINQTFSRWEESAIRNTLVADHGVFDVPPSPDNTAGLAWSEDGRTLFVGAQNGIYELHINIQGRKLSSSCQPR